MKKIIYPVFLISGCLILISGTIDLNNLFNYANQEIPDYITKDNTTPDNPITDEGATLGRVLFYDKNLSANQTISCAGCHHQEFAFGDTAKLSLGLSGEMTGRHAMRLVNTRYSDERRFFWDERARSLEDQSTQPIQDHIEMGFSGTNGDPTIDELITRLEGIDYYEDLFELVYGDTRITEERMQLALAQFIRSIQSFDSRFDEGLEQAVDIRIPFPNFTDQENIGKQIYLNPPGPNGAGCNGCHRAPEFDIDPRTQNNGIIAVANDLSAVDLTNTRAPSLRDMVNPRGQLNGPLMHDGSLNSLRAVIDHYNNITIDPQNISLDQRLRGRNNQGQNLNLSEDQKLALEAFLLTLTGSNMYTDERWSDPFDIDGNLAIIPIVNTSTSKVDEASQIGLYPNPTIGPITIDAPQNTYTLTIFYSNGKVVQQQQFIGQTKLDLGIQQSGVYLLQFTNEETGQMVNKRIIKQ